MTATAGRGAAAVLVGAWALSFASSPAHGGETLKKLEKEFKTAIERASGATVVCLPPDGVRPAGFGSSGVIVSRKGLVLSDGDVGRYRHRKDGRFEPAWADEVTVRVPDLKRGGFKPYRAQVLHRDRELDTSLLRVVDGPPSGFSGYLRPYRSEHLRVGSFAFAAGNAWALSREGAPTLTAGVVAALTYLPENHEHGRLAHLYISAAVNPGVNGGPVVDVQGRLIGTVSGAVGNGPEDAFQFLGRIVPIDRLRAVYGKRDEARELFPSREAPAARADAAETMETVFHHTAREAYPAVVSLEVHRTPLEPPKPDSGADGEKESGEEQGEGETPGEKEKDEKEKDEKEKDEKGKDGKGQEKEQPRPPPRRPPLPPFPSYRGPVSGFLVSNDGLIVTSLYNMTSLMALTHPRFVNPTTHPEFDVRRGMERIRRVTVHLADGVQAEAKVLAYHEGLGVTLLKADLPAGATSTRRVLVPAPRESFVAGRFVLALGNPFGAERLPDPLVTLGILSKRHAGDAEKSWRGQWQTDAAATDANSGGPAVDLNGRLLGMITPWDITHGRNSGVGFVVPWHLIEEVLPQMREGRTFARAFLGVSWDVREAQEGETVNWLVEPAKIKAIVDGSAAQEAGMQPGDVIVGLDDETIVNIGDASDVLGRKYSGETLRVSVLRAGQTVTFDVVLGMRK